MAVLSSKWLIKARLVPCPLTIRQRNWLCKWIPAGPHLQTLQSYPNIAPNPWRRLYRIEWVDIKLFLLFLLLLLLLLLLFRFDRVEVELGLVYSRECTPMELLFISAPFSPLEPPLSQDWYLDNLNGSKSLSAKYLVVIRRDGGVINSIETK